MPKIKKRKFRKTVGQADQLRAKKNLSEYKSLDSYLNAVYSNNQQYLNEHIETFGDTRQKRAIFKQEVKDLLNETNPETGKAYTVKQAIDYVQRSTTIRTRDQRGFEVVMSRMREEAPDAFKKFRLAVGWHNKIRSEYVSYIGARGKWMDYEYNDPTTGKRFKISVKISPGTDGVQDVVISLVDKDQKRVSDAADKSFEDILIAAGLKKGEF